MRWHIFSFISTIPLTGIGMCDVYRFLPKSHVPGF
jgi:hypothetical protein